VDGGRRSAIVGVWRVQIGTESQQELAERLREIEARLEARFGRPRWESHGPPLDQLIATVLSQHTSDTNTERAFASLCRRFPDWEDVVAAPVADVATAIRSGGLANLKAPRIQRILREVADETGTYALDWLADEPLDVGRAWLLSLPGVGPKTAACVLLFSLGMPAMPVDTHVHRLSRRLGLIPPHLGADMAHAALERQIGPDRDRIYAWHLNLIQHGRTTCHARHPKCGACVLADICPSAMLPNVPPSAR
jgi:endonuclease-3